MIKLQNYAPEVYYKHSRDFQYIGRLYDVVLNYIKTNSELLNGLPYSLDSDEKFLEHILCTFGFKPKHVYNISQLRAVASVFNEAIKYKGSMHAIEIVGNALLASEGIKSTILVTGTKNGKTFSLTNPTVLELMTPDYISIYINISDLILFNDLLDFLLPAGLSCQIIRHEKFEGELPDTDKYYTLDSVTINALSRDLYNNTLFAGISELHPESPDSSTELTGGTNGSIKLHNLIDALLAKELELDDT